MNDAAAANVDSLLRVSIFAEANAADFPAGSKIAGYFAAVKSALERLEQSGAIVAGAVSAKRSGTSRKSAARQTLIENLRHIAKIARVIEDEEAAFENKFILPRANLNTSVLLEAARSFAAHAPAVKAKFVEYSMDADFIDELTDDLQDFESAFGAQNAAGIESVGGNADADAILAAALAAKSKADPIVRYIYRASPQKLAEWNTAKHVARPARKVNSEKQTLNSEK